MSRESKAKLIERLVAEIRASQTAVETMDDAARLAFGVNRTDGRCMDILDQEAPMTAGALAARSGLTTAAVTAVLDRLEEAGYARRVADPADRRRVLVEPTELARERSRVIYGPLAEAVGELSRYTAEELRLLTDFHRWTRELNEKRAAEVRELRFD